MEQDVKDQLRTLCANVIIARAQVDANQEAMFNFLEKYFERDVMPEFVELYRLALKAHVHTHISRLSPLFVQEELDAILKQVTKILRSSGGEGQS